MDVDQKQAMVKFASIVLAEDTKAAAVAVWKDRRLMGAAVEAYEIKERVVECALLAIFCYESIKRIQSRVIVRNCSVPPVDTLLVAKQKASLVPVIADNFDTSHLNQRFHSTKCWFRQMVMIRVRLDSLLA